MLEYNLRMDTSKKPYALGAIILSAGFILSTLIGAYTFLKVRSLDDVLTVTGSARMEVVADKVKWVTVINRPTTPRTLKAGYEQMANDLALVKKFYTDNGIDEKMLSISPVFMDEVYSNYMTTGADKQYNLRQTFMIDSTDVNGVTKLTKNTGSLIASGVVFSTQTLEYSYSKLADLRVSMLKDAVTDAKARANELVNGTGKSVGKLKSASSGVVQVQAKGSNEVSDYGSYDMSTIDKSIMVTVKVTFALN